MFVSTTLFFVLIIHYFDKAILSTVNQNKYATKSIGEQRPGLVYKKILGRKSSLQWAALCSKHDACRSFYVDDGACVFGLSDDVTEFANGDDVTPADGQMLKTKGKAILCVNISLKHVEFNPSKQF